MMTFGGIAIFILLTVLLPFLAGWLFVGQEEATKGLVFAWLRGQMLFWAVFQLIAVPVIIRGGSFPTVVKAFSAAMALLSLAGLLCLLRRGKEVFGRKPKRLPFRLPSILWLLFFVLLFYQFYQILHLAYADGDDAFYIAIAAMTQDSDTMYALNPYTGLSTGLTVRYGLAPFPIWLAYLARMTDISVATIAHVLVPFVTLSLAYAAFYQLAKGVLAKAKAFGVPLFMLFAEVLILYGNVSLYTPETFLMTRSAQGKAVLAGIIIPVVLLLLWMQLQALEEKKTMPVSFYVLFALTLLAGTLMSTFSGFLLLLLTAMGGLCMLLTYRRFLPVIFLALSCVPAGCMSLLYFLLT